MIEASLMVNPCSKASWIDEAMSSMEVDFPKAGPDARYLSLAFLAKILPLLMVSSAGSKASM